MANCGCSISADIRVTSGQVPAYVAGIYEG